MLQSYVFTFCIGPAVPEILHLEVTRSFPAETLCFLSFYQKVKKIKVLENQKRKSRTFLNLKSAQPFPRYRILKSKAFFRPKRYYIIILSKLDENKSFREWNKKNFDVFKFKIGPAVPEISRFEIRAECCRSSLLELSIGIYSTLCAASVWLCRRPGTCGII